MSEHEWVLNDRTKQFFELSQYPTVECRRPVGTDSCRRPQGHEGVCLSLPGKEK
jgi:hypothetical protein